MTDREIMAIWLESGGEALYDLARQGEGKPWPSASREVKDDFRAIVRRIIEAGHVAELEARDRQPRVLP